MTDRLDEALSERFALQQDELPMPDFADVLRRATAITAHVEARKWPSIHRLPATLGVRRVLVAAVVVAALVGVGVAIAASFGAFSGISAAQHPQSGADSLDLKDLPPDCNSGSPVADSPFCHLILSSARLLRTVPGGGKLWVVTDTQGDLCVILERGAGSCTGSLTPSQPTTITSGRESDQTPWMGWGIALDSVAAVSFPVGGQEVTVPVENNVWFYEGDTPGNLAAMTIHFKDGSTEQPQSNTTPSGSG